MSKSILISIRPEWVEKILNGEKTIEIRKTIPKCKLPCKVYIYCSWGNMRTNYMLGKRGKVVAEFTLTSVVKFDIESIMFLGKQQELMQKSKLGGLSLRKYLGNGVGYAWGIDNLKIYDKPKELSEFSVGKAKIDCGYGNYNIYNKILKRPPQSWCYVEKVVKDE